MDINGITVRISDGVKTADYAPPKLYDLTANITPGGNPEADALAAVQMLQRVGDTYLGRTTAPVTAAEVPAPPPKAKAKEKPAADPAAIAPPPEPKQPAADSIVTPDDLSDLVTVQEISDAELNTAVTRRLQELGPTGPAQVRGLKDSYNPEPGKRVLQIRELTQEQRADFLAKLAELKGA